MASSFKVASLRSPVLPVAPQILITGLTGYIGGSVLAAITKAHPEYSITAILRKVSQGYVDAYPRVKTIVGDYDSAEILVKAASGSDIVIHAGDSDHKGAMEALLKGLGRRTGTACISDVYSGNFGVLNPRVWSDVDDIEEIAALPENRIHRHVDKIVFEAAATHGAHIHTAIMCPPDIYGKGHGPRITQSFMVPFFYDSILAHKSAFYVAKGENTRSLVHIQDVMSLYVSVVEEAVSSLETGTVRAEYWGKNGFYFNSSSELAWKDAAVATGKLMASLGLIESAEPKEVTVENIQSMLGGTGLGLYLFGSNSRSRADRARNVFGWKPTGPGFMEVMEADLLAHHRDKQRDIEKNGLDWVPPGYVDAYPRVKTIVGDYDSAEILAKAASESDIIIHAGDSSKSAMEAFLEGLGRRSTSSFLIHLSGTSCIADFYSGDFMGLLNPACDDRVNRPVDKIVFEAAATHGAHIHTAIVCPPDIYGKGHGPGLTQSFMVPYFYDSILEHKSAFYLAKGENTRSVVHIEDVMGLYVRIVEEAVTSLETGTVRDECWGKNGFYFDSGSEIVWKDFAAATGKVMASLGLIDSADPKEATAEEVQRMMGGSGLAFYLFGSNSRSRADRAGNVFGWKPTGPGAT
ncbi:NAD(P)-binding protein [Mycena venus]|uniref:NAD(P)-binding protein n=1 Tax=Mycena venus TaxID=2733690 RepID=A0A8H6XCS7_9AGAR|nr:NAD(P)-binding protein [Mycena venus]